MDIKKWMAVRPSSKWYRDMFSEFCKSLVLLEIDESELQWNLEISEWSEDWLETSHLHFHGSKAGDSYWDSLYLEEILLPKLKSHVKPARDIAKMFPKWKLNDQPEIDHSFL